MSIIRRTQQNHVKFQARAFTLLESLLTLSVTCFLILVVSVAFQKTVHVAPGELFVLEFETILKDQQAQAITTARSRRLASVNGIVKLNGTKLQVPNETKFSDFDITFNANGNIQSLKEAKIVITLPYESGAKISYQLQIGSGQYKKTRH